MAEASAARPSEGTGRPNRWIMFVAGQRVCPLCSFCTFFLTGMLFALVFVREAIEKSDAIFSFDAQVVRSDVDVQRYYAFRAARGEELQTGCGDEQHQARGVCEDDEQCEWSSQRCEDKQVCPHPDPKPRQSMLLYRGAPAWAGIVYEAKNGRSLLDDDMLGYIDKFERILLTTANGAVNSSGDLSPWDQDWCLKAYPAGNDGHPGKCAATLSVLNLFSMNAHGRQVTARQVAEGFTAAGPLSCLCSDADALCSVCTPEGGLKGFGGDPAHFSLDAWPADVVSCAARYAAQNADSAEQRANRTQKESMCSRTLTGSSVQDLLPVLTSLCAWKPTCQWEPPGGGFCSSTAFYRATDGDGLVEGAEKERVMSRMCDERDLKWTGMRKAFLPASFDCESTAKEAKFARTTFFPGGQTDSDAEGENFEQNYIKNIGGWYSSEQSLERQIEQESGGDLRVMLFSAATVRSQYLQILMVDMILSITSLVLVWTYMWWTLESAFLASCAMFEIIFSLPVAMCLWTVVLKQQIQFFQMLTVYMILGIGADDAFILQDAWLQAPFVGGDEVASDWKKRFAWAYKRSFNAMAVTTATTCGSFLIGAFSPLPQVRDFCIFAAVVVFVDWVFCETFFASAIVVHERFLGCGFQKGQCMGPGCCCGLWRCCAAACCKSLVGEIPPPGAPPQKRAMERWFEGSLFNSLVKGRCGFIVLWCVVIIGMCANAGISLRTATKANPQGRESLDTIRGAEILANEFTVFGVPAVSMVWGLDDEQPISEWGSTHADNVASHSPAAIASFVSPEGQRDLLNLCRAADAGRDEGNTRCDSSACLINGNALPGTCEADQDVLRRTGVYIPADSLCQTGRYCFMEDVARYWAWNESGCENLLQMGACLANVKCSWDESIRRCYPSMYDQSYIDYPGLPADQFITLLKSPGYRMYSEERNEILKESGFAYIVSDERMLTGVRMDSNGVALAWVSFNATFRASNSVTEANAWYSRWETYMAEAAPTIGGFHTADLWLFMVTQNEMVKAAIMGVGLSLLMAFAVLLFATRNWWVSFLGLLNITGVAVVFLGLMPAIGWSLGENECIFLIAVVGLSVDYSVHLLHVYNGSKAEDRVARAKDALGEMGISVTNSAITTLLASAILFNCGFYFFLQFGAFIFLVIVLSILMSIFFLIPLLMVAGPEGTQGDFLTKRSQQQATD